MGRLVRGWACRSDIGHGKGRFVSTDRLDPSEILIEGELDHGDPSEDLFWRIAPGWRVIDGATSADYTGLCNFMAGVAKVGWAVSDDLVRYEFQQSCEKFHTSLYSRGRKAHVSAEWSRRVSEKVKQLEQGRRESVPWSPYGY